MPRSTPSTRRSGTSATSSWGSARSLTARHDLVGGLAALVGSLRLSTVTDLELEVDDIPDSIRDLDDETTTQLIHIAREALSNVTRHSKATRATVQVSGDDAAIHLIVSDNGIGFRAPSEGQRGAPGDRQHARARVVAGRFCADRERADGRHPYHRGRAEPSWGREIMTDPAAVTVHRLLIVDDHEVVRQGLVALLDRRENFQVVAEAGTAAEAIEQARRHRPDIVIMDVRLPDGSGVEACREIRAEFDGDPRRHADVVPG